MRVGALNRVYNFRESLNGGYLWQVARRARTMDSLGIYGQNLLVLQALGLVHYDTSARAGIVYQYRVKPVGEQATSKEGRTTAVSYPQKMRVDYQLRTLRAEPFEQSISLQYLVGRGRPTPAGLAIYRQVYMQTNFEPIGQVAYFRQVKDSVVLSIEDPSVRRQLVYQYVAVPLDMYGNPGIPSDTVRILNLTSNLTPTVYQINATSRIEKNAIELSWQVKNPDKVQVINIYRSQDYDQPTYHFVGSVSASDTTFVDANVKPVEGYWYTLVVNGVYGQAPASPRVHGILKTNPKRIPLPPHGLQASAENHQVKLSWHKADAETRGFAVFRGQTPQDLKQVSPEIPYTPNLNTTDQTEFVDHLPVTAQSTQYYYAVRTINTSYNQSPLSAMTNVIINGQTKLKAPMSVKVKYFDKTALVYWANPNESGVTGYNLYRRESNQREGNQRESNGSWQKLNAQALPVIQNQWEDKTLQTGKVYEYQVELVTGRESDYVRSAPVRLALEAKKPLQPVGLRVMAQPDNTVQLSWSAMPAGAATQYAVYRQQSGGKPEKLAVLPLSQTHFMDKNSAEGLFFYTVVAVSAEEVESEADNWISVTR
ncbi:fibronectin type III domain-containing protein [Cytophagaceae bacterium YF14B1]|uniref:Fibronectin type III domain-containing protein n=1 Tax=Xanthocytophaga flava TaxID=3048013 RepID=A0AAE3QZZ9_9BACT|nr:fibronectin type III domain-containing protein [Xanthocytophaga flavus]MDJ1485618.1 fibronectin type III domain-containing protein [Xanthocytophaga flavus]